VGPAGPEALGGEQPPLPDARARLPARLVRASVLRPRRALALAAGSVALFALGLPALRIETTTESVLDRSRPEWAEYQESQRRFGGDEFLAIALEADAPFARDLLRRVETLSEALEGLPGVRRVDSLASVPVVSGTPEGALSLDPPLRDLPWESPGAGELVRERLRADRVAPGSLVSEEGRVAALNVLLEADAEYGAVFAGIESALAGSPAWVSGVPVFRLEASETTREELLLFVPITVALAAGLLFALFRSLRAVLIALAPSAGGSVVLLGSMGALGAPLTLTTAILPSIVLVLGCMYASHLLVAARGRADPAHLLTALEHLALPVALCGLTTAVGFAASALVAIDAIRFVGGFGALGVLAVLALTLGAVPAALRLWPLPERGLREEHRIFAQLARSLVRAAQRRGRWLLGAWLAACLGLAAGLGWLRVETDATRWFPPGHEVRDAYEAIRARLSGISPLNVVIESRNGRPVTEPEALRAIDALAQHLAAQPEIGKALSLADPLRQLHGGFAGDASQPLPPTRELAEQYLLLLESLEQLPDLVTADRRAANILLRADDNGSAHLLAVGEKVERWWAQHGPAGFEATPTGVMYQFALALEEVAQGQIRGLAFASLTISAILLAIFRELRVALVALVPNVVPVLMIFGVMGLLGVPLDAGTAFIGSLVLGVAVDDTIHLVSAFRAQPAGLAPGEALERALRQVLPPVVYSAIVISLSFAIFALSEFHFTRDMGLLMAGVMLVCMLADLTLLPALLLRLKASREAVAVPAPPAVAALL
jgi:predicted RND superfamily exporter protein